MMPDLSVSLGRLRLPNPVLVASGTFGYAKEMEGVTDLARLGGIVPKTVTMAPRAGNPPPRTVETASGMLNAIGLDNDGLDHFLDHHLPYLRTVGCPIILNIAAKAEEEFPVMARKARGLAGLAALELNLSCPNVAGGIDFATNPEACARVVRSSRDACPDLPILAKLTPLVTDLVAVARAAAEAGADAVSLTNTFPGIVLDWRRRRPYLGNGPGGLSGHRARLASQAAVPGQWRRRPFRAGDQAFVAPLRLECGARRAGVAHRRHRRRRHHRRCHGLSGGRSLGGADGHGEFLRPGRRHPRHRGASRGAGNTGRFIRAGGRGRRGGLEAPGLDPLSNRRCERRMSKQHRVDTRRSPRTLGGQF
jgi:dihydroorotate dehydrogenase (NAD+) catalytic subunit